MIHKSLNHQIVQLMGQNHLCVHFLIRTDHFHLLANVLQIKCIKWVFLYHVQLEHVNYLVKMNLRYAILFTIHLVDEINVVYLIMYIIYYYLKVIEFLIQIHSIEETSGYSADRIEQALVVNNFNNDNAIKFLMNVDRLIDFGFREENICSALVKCNNDPDKALDSLVSY